MILMCSRTNILHLILCITIFILFACTCFHLPIINSLSNHLPPSNHLDIRVKGVHHSFLFIYHAAFILPTCFNLLTHLSIYLVINLLKISIFWFFHAFYQF